MRCRITEIGKQIRFVTLSSAICEGQWSLIKLPIDLSMCLPAITRPSDKEGQFPGPRKQGKAINTRTRHLHGEVFLTISHMTHKSRVGIVMAHRVPRSQTQKQRIENLRCYLDHRLQTNKTHKARILIQPIRIYGAGTVDRGCYW